MIVQGPSHGSPSPSLNTRKSMAALLFKQIFPNLRPDNSSVEGDVFEVVVHISSYRLYIYICTVRTNRGCIVSGVYYLTYIKSLPWSYLPMCVYIIPPKYTNSFSRTKHTLLEEPGETGRDILKCTTSRSYNENISIFLFITHLLYDFPSNFSALQTA
jgi:hypothetical protein